MSSIGNSNVLLRDLEAGKFKIQAPARLHSGEGHLPSELQTAGFSLCPRVVEGAKERCVVSFIRVLISFTRVLLP